MSRSSTFVAYQSLGTARDDRESRTRLLDATVELAARGGLGKITIGAVTDAAGLTRRTFYRYFGDVPDAFLAASLELHGELRATVDRAWATSDDAEQRALSCIDALFDLITGDPLRATVLFVEGPAGGTALDGLRTETREWAIGLLTGGSPGRPRPRPQTIDGDDPVLRTLAEMAVGGIYTVVWRHLVHGEIDALADAKPFLVEAALRPHDWQRHQRRGQRA